MAQQKMELFFAAENLISMDMFSKSDPMVVVKRPTDPFAKPPFVWVEIGRTESIKNAKNPVFKKTVITEYAFEIAQPVRFEVYDIDNGSTKSLNDDDFIGYVEMDLSAVVSKPKTHIPLIPSKKLHNKTVGSLIVYGQSIGENSDEIEIKVEGKQIPSKDFLGKSDPYYTLAKKVNDKWTVTKKSEVIKNTATPNWKPLKFNLLQAANGMLNTPIQFCCYDWDDDGTSDYIGEIVLTVADIFGNPMRPENGTKATKEYTLSGNGKFAGKVVIHATYNRSPSFVDYLAGGLKMNLIVGIDFSASTPEQQQLHAINPQGFNEYEWAIHTIGSTIAYYDSDQMFPTFGFGAKLAPKYDKIEHIFSLNGNPSNPEVFGIQGILGAYRNMLAGPTPLKFGGVSKFKDLLAWTNAYTKSLKVTQENQQYVLLLLITDGSVDDMNDTIKEIITGSELPLSVVIVGVGNGDGKGNFKQMQLLDADNSVLKAPNGKGAKRDIVQFVPYRQFFGKSMQALAQATLGELPNQVLEYMRLNKINPKKVPAFQY